MLIQVKHLRRAVSPPGLRGREIAAIFLAGSSVLFAGDNGEGSRREGYLAAGLRTGQPTFGLAVQHTKSGARVSRIFDHGPASEAGLQPGETLLSGDGIPLGDKPQGELVAFLRAHSSLSIRVKNAAGAERTVFLKKMAPETFANESDQTITERFLDLSLADVEIGKAPPDFTASVNGKSKRLGELSGRPVVVIFWATWCLPCMAEVPTLKTLYAKFHPRGVEFMGVSLDDDRAKVDRYLQTQHVPWPQNFDGKGSDNAVAQEWNVASIPVLVLLGKDGRVLEKKVPIGELGALLEKALR